MSVKKLIGLILFILPTLPAMCLLHELGHCFYCTFGLHGTHSITIDFSSGAFITTCGYKQQSQLDSMLLRFVGGFFAFVMSILLVGSLKLLELEAKLIEATLVLYAIDSLIHALLEALVSEFFYDHPLTTSLIPAIILWSIFYLKTVINELQTA